MVRNVLIIILVLIVAVVVVNDAGRWISTQFNLTEITSDVAQVAARTQGSRDAAAIAASEFATSQGLTLYAYDQDEQAVYVYTETELKDTLVLAPFLSLLTHRDYKVPYMMRDEDSSPRAN